MSIQVIQQANLDKEIHIEFIKKFNMIVLALEKSKVRFNIHEFVNEKDD